MTKALICILFFCCAPSAIYATPQNDLAKTYGLENGRYWNSMEPSARPIYLEGITYGWTLRGYEGPSSGAVVQALSNGGVSLTYEELAEMITSVYRDPENRAIPIGWTMLAEAAVHRGETTQKVVMSALRKQLLKMAGKPTLGNQLSPIDTILSVSKTP